MIKLETFRPEEQRGCLLNQSLRLLVDATSLADGSPQTLLRINALRKCLAVSPGNCEICLFYTNPADGNSNPLVSALENIGAGEFLHWFKMLRGAGQLGARSGTITPAKILESREPELLKEEFEVALDALMITDEAIEIEIDGGNSVITPLLQRTVRLRQLHEIR